ncbi:MAG TPA: hypothetical protein VL306_02720 [Methylomirabilota bacterium]|jgi:hypothetical protein|nr:hypothetical protein [Methylomirabilota bacterium]
MEALNPKKEEYAREVCMFLGEQLRTHHLTLARSADIAQKVLENLNLIDTETDFLKFIKELERDFQELVALSSKLSFEKEISDRQEMEASVREFAISMLPQDVSLALSVLEDAIKEKVTLAQLIKKFPNFDDFLNQRNESLALIRHR